jgi:hypothetical protein
MEKDRSVVLGCTFSLLCLFAAFIILRFSNVHAAWAILFFIAAFVGLALSIPGLRIAFLEKHYRTMYEQNQLAKHEIVELPSSEAVFIVFALEYGKKFAKDKNLGPQDRKRIEDYFIREFDTILNDFKRATKESFVDIEPLMRKVINAYLKDK